MMPQPPHKLILDVDTGTDDAVAIMFACLHPGLELVGITTVNGNVTVGQATENTLRILDHIGSALPVFQGASKPFSRADFPIPRAERKQSGIHMPELPLPAARSRKADGAAVEFLIETYRRATDPIALVPVGPLTNIATAITRAPDLVEKISQVVIMGGAHWTGNVTPRAEFNIWADPEAAATVLGAGLRKVTLVPLDATHKALISKDDCRRLRELGTPAGLASADLIEHRIAAYDATQPMSKLGAAPVHDVVCVAALVDPDVIVTAPYHVAVETHGALTTGSTIIDVAGRNGMPANAWVAFDARADRLNAALLETFQRSHIHH
jgi:inosine-uridine nucleoside N-ribohydrolase